MITDNLKNAKLYYGLGERMEKALKYLQENDFSKFEPGKYVVDGINVFALVQKYESKPMEIGKWEAHRKYIDIQYLVDGTERIGYAYIEDMKPIQNYNEGKDIAFTEGNGSFLEMKGGMFAIFAPDDIHMPGIEIDKPQAIRKVVVKVLV